MEPVKRSSLMFKDNVTTQAEPTLYPSRIEPVYDPTSFVSVQSVKKQKPYQPDSGNGLQTAGLDDDLGRHSPHTELDSGDGPDEAMSGSTAQNDPVAEWQCEIESLDPYKILSEMVERRKVSDSPVDQLIPVKVVAGDSPSSFYVQIKDRVLESVFEDLGDKLEGAIDLDKLPTEPKTFDVGDIAIVLFQTSSVHSTQYLRCSIDDIVHNEAGNVDFYEVTCIDFGQKLKPKPCNIVEAPLETFKKIPPFAFHCSLANIFPTGLTDGWSRQSIDLFHEFLKNDQEFFIWVKNDLTHERPSKIQVNLVTQIEIIPGPFHPAIFTYTTAIDQLSEKGYCILKSLCPGPFDSDLLNGPSADGTNPRGPLKVDRDALFPSNLQNLVNKYNERKNEWFAVEKTHYLPPTKLENSEFKALVTDIAYDGTIHARIEPTVGAEKDLMKQVNRKIYRALNFDFVPLPQFDPNDFQLHQAASAIYPEDDTTNRVSIIGKGKEPDTFIVKFIDYGQEVELPVDKIFKAVFCPEIPALAQRFEFYEIEFPSEKHLRDAVINNIFCSLVDNVCTFKWENAYSEPMKVTIEYHHPDKDSPENINELLVASGHVYRKPDMDAIPTKVSDIRDILRQSDFLDPRITFVPNVFYKLQCGIVYCNNYIFFQHRTTSKKERTGEEERIFDLEKKFLALQDEINNNVATFKPLGSFIPFLSPCVAQSSIDDRFYRGIVIDSDHMPTKKIFFIDYGNIEKVSKEKMRQIPSKYSKKVPPHTFLFRVGNIRPKKGKQWSDVRKAMEDHLEGLDQDEKLIGKFELKRVGSEHEEVVDLYIARDSDSDTPVQHAFSELVKQGILEFIDPSAVEISIY